MSKAASVLAMKPTAVELIGSELKEVSSKFNFSVFSAVGSAPSSQTSVSSSQSAGGQSPSKDDMSPFNVFQRFCIMLIALHGDLDMITQ